LLEDSLYRVIENTAVSMDIMPDKLAITSTELRWLGAANESAVYEMDLSIQHAV